MPLSAPRPLLPRRRVAAALHQAPGITGAGPSGAPPRAIWPRAGDWPIARQGAAAPLQACNGHRSLPAGTGALPPASGAPRA